jgi:hypothetical protein
MAKALSQMTANQAAQPWVNFLRDCQAYGDDVVYEEQQTTGGTWDAVKDTMVGGSTETVSTTYRKGSLAAPVVLRGSAEKGSIGTAFVMGHQLGEVVAGETHICRMRAEIPLTKSGVYLINGQRWKFTRLIDSYRVGKRTFWNLVQFMRA